MMFFIQLWSNTMVQIKNMTILHDFRCFCDLFCANNLDTLQPKSFLRDPDKNNVPCVEFNRV